VVAKKKIKGRTVYIIKAKGPGGRLGKLGKAVEKIIKRERVAKVITVDAAAKLEGEKTGSIAEGIGVAIGGPGVDKSYIENITTQMNIPLDTVVIKMSQEESIQPMKTEVINAVSSAVDTVDKVIADTTERGSIIVVGVGNTAGVGNNAAAAKQADELARKVYRTYKEKMEEKKKSFWDNIGF
jgi:hypothetical protein